MLGTAVVNTPLLERPLTGSVYLRTSVHELPDLALDLHGQIDFEAAARVDSVNGRLQASFTSLPDVPISRAVLNLAGGSQGLRQNTESLCGTRKRATTRIAGQNGARLNVQTKLQLAACGSTARRKHRLDHLRRADQR